MTHLTKLLSVFAIALVTFSSQASMDDAKKAFESRNYESAYKEFMKYAKIGNAQAQYYIGLMYYQGKGTTSDIYEANAWFSLSREGGHRESVEMIQRLRRELPSKREAKLVAQDLETVYGDDALSESLFPYISASNVQDKQLLPVTVKNPSVPNASGWALVSVSIDDTGRVKQAEIFNSYPEGVFDRQAVQAARQWVFKPQESDGQMTQVDDYLIKFEFRSTKAMSHQSYLRSLSKYTDLLINRASVGDAKSQYLLSRLYGQGIIRPRMSDKVRTAAEWLLEASKSGDAQARYELALRLLEGRGVDSDPSKAFAWLEMSANDGYPSAQYTYAKEILNSNPTKRQFEKAVALLKQAEVEGNQNASQELGILYATSTHYDFFDPYKSSLIAKEGLYNDKDHPEYLMIMGASYSAQGSDSQSSEYLSKAYLSALDRGWPTNQIISLAQQLSVDINVKGVPVDLPKSAQPTAIASNGSADKLTETHTKMQVVKQAKKKRKLVAIDRVGPVYPIEAEEEGLEGWVKLSYSVNRNGLVEDIQVMKSSSDVFDQAAIDALKQWRYEPIIQNGSTIKKEGFKVKLAFSLDQLSTN